MGAFISKNKVESDNYEKILSDLDGDIQKKEIQLSEIRIKDRRLGLLWLLYSTLLWIIYIVYYLYAIHGKYQDVQTAALTVSPIVLGPLCIFYIRKGLKWMYYKKLTSIETSLTSLRKKQKLKVEELKKKTAYYSTKSLLERYDPASEKKKELDEQKKKKLLEEKEQQKKRKAQQQPLPPQCNQQQTQQMASMKGNQQVGMKPQAPMQQQQWYDKLVDALVGDSGPETKYALICTHCYAHNGLVLPQEIEAIQYTCPHCHQFNPSRKSRMLHPNGPVLPPMSPTTSEEDHSNKVGNNNKEQPPPTTTGSTAIKQEDSPLRQRNTTTNND